MRSSAKTVSEYLKELPADRRQAIETLRTIILKNIPEGIEENMNWGMIAYEVPLKTYPKTYNGRPLMYAGLASQKNYMALYLTNIYGSVEMEKKFRAAYAKTGKKLDMGRSCIRFKKLEDLPLELIGKTLAKTSLKDFLVLYENILTKRQSTKR